MTKRSGQWAVLLVLALTWGSSFILMKKGMAAFSPPQVAALRIVSAFAVLAPVIIMRFRRVGRQHWLPVCIVGLFGNAIPSFLFTKAQTVIDSSLAGIINSLTPLFTLLLGVFVFGLRARPLQYAGIFVGLSGALLLLADGLEFGPRSHFGLYAVAATICYGLTVNVIKRYLHSLDAVLITSFAFLFAGPPLTVWLLTTDFTERLASAPGAWESFGYVMILGVVGTALAVIIFNMLIKATTHLFAISVTYLVPVVAILWGAIDGETVGAAEFSAIGIILAGVYMVNR